MKSVGAFLDSADQVLVCTHATFRFAVDKFGVAAFDGRLIAVDEFHDVSASPDNKLGVHLGAFVGRGQVHVLAMTGSYLLAEVEVIATYKLTNINRAKLEAIFHRIFAPAQLVRVV